MSYDAQTGGDIEWNIVLNEFRKKKGEACCPDNWNVFVNQCLPFFSAVSKPIVTYIDHSSMRGKDGHDKTSKEESQRIISETRNALRFSLFCFSIPSDEARAILQEDAMQSGCWYRLVELLLIPTIDAKCRTMSAQLLCNLITQNPVMAKLISTIVQLAPSDEAITQRAFQSIMCCPQSETSSSDDSTIRASWVDMMQCAIQSGNREALGALAASIHNCIVALQLHHEQDGFVRQVASSNLLISTLLRHVINSGSISSVSNRKNASLGDEATEWISLLFVKLCRIGLVKHLFTSLYSHGKVSSEIFPEHVVLLHIIMSEIESQTDKTCCCAVLGSETGSIAESYQFLCLTISDVTFTPDPLCSENHESLKQSATLIVLEILAESLADEGKDSASVREAVGKSTDVIHRLCQTLGVIIDTLKDRNEGRHVRDVIVSPDEQAELTILVRVLGNLCFRCKRNQDLIRTTLVPHPTQLIDRRGLHVLLSCTAYSHACFTLREWSVIAISNVLDDNLENQNMVALLDAQNAVQSQTLCDMGIRVSLDSNRRVSVQPVESAENNKGRDLDSKPD